MSPRLEFRRKSSRPAARLKEPRRSPLLVVAGAAAAGVALARVIDWRSHAHPR